MPAMQLYEPISTLKPVAEDLWIVDGPIVRMAFGWLKVPFPTRMVVARLGDGTLWVWSPVALEPRLRAELDRLGPVRHLVSPNRIHYEHIPAWQAAYPDAIAWASPGVRERAASQHITVAFDHDLGDDAPAAWRDEIHQLVFRGSAALEEVVFFHRKSHTLILADLIENFERDKVRGPWRWVVALGGVLDPDGKAPRDLRWTFRKHRDLARRCYEHMLAWAPQRIIMAHGRWYPQDGVHELRRAFRWTAP